MFGISHDGRRIVGISADIIRVYGSNAKVSRSYNPKSVSPPDFMVFSQTVPLMVFNDGQNIRGSDVSLGTDLWTVRATGTPISLAMTPSGSFIVAGTDNGNIEQYTDKGVLVWSYSSTRENTTAAGISGVALSKDGKLVAGGTTDGTVLILDGSGKLQGSYKAKEPIRSVTMSSDGSLVLAAGEENIYAFFTTPSSGSSSTPVSYYQFDPKNLTPGFNTSGQNITPIPAPPSGNPPLTTPSVMNTITEVPTTYSIIRTATQSPVDPIISLMGIGGAVLLIMRRR
jgi:WD40 repeat protein